MVTRGFKMTFEVFVANFNQNFSSFLKYCGDNISDFENLSAIADQGIDIF